jgi:hypothetical protein
MRGIVLVVLLVGCTQTPQEKSQDVCQAYCTCTDPGAVPSVVDDCINQQCLPQLPPVTDQCLDCVFAHDQVCTDLFAQCEDLCFQTGGMP